MSHPPTLLTTPEAALDAVRRCEADLVLDFDHTLFLGNSTERWLDSLRPRTLGLLAVLAVDLLLRVLGKLRLCDVPRWRDQACVAVTWALFPWSRAAWRREAAACMAAGLNRPLAEAALLARPSEITVLSFGFEQVLAPLVAALPLRVRLVASNAFSHDQNLRLHGKLPSLEAALDARRVRAAVFVTDSRSDQDVLDVAGTPALVQWAPYTPPAFDGAYLPMRYACVGKYAGRRYLTTQILQEDLALWVLAYSWNPGALPLLFVLFLAMYCIYEIGYWENDHVAAKNEATPTLSETAARFERYPIAWAWVWAAGFLLGVATLGGIGVAGATAAVLLALRAAFWRFNRVSVRARRWLFPLLHAVKLFLPLLVFPASLVGLVLLLAQWFSQIALYFRHRGAGNAAAFNRPLLRLVLFLLLVPLALFVLPGQNLAGIWAHVPGLQGSLIAGWLLFRLVQRTHGRRIFSIIRNR